METKDEIVFCSECGANIEYGHGSFCTEQDKEQMLKNIKFYYKAHIGQRKILDSIINKYKKEVTFWQGKFSIVVAENNKLRKKLIERKNND